MYALGEHRPGVVVVNAGGARFNEGDPIAKTATDVAEVVRRVGGSPVVAVHMEAINHCLLGRDDLRLGLVDLGAWGGVSIPTDGDGIGF